MRKCHLWAFLVAATFSIAAHASPAVTFDANQYIVPRSSIATIKLFVTDNAIAATEDIEGMILTLQIQSGAGTSPFIQTSDPLSNTIWTGHVSDSNVTSPAGGSEPQFVSRDLLTDNAGDFVNANGLLATFTIDTTGALLGDYPLLLVGTMDPANDSAFLNGNGSPLSALFGQATLTVSPEPSSLISAGVLALLCLASRQMRRRQLS
jgi:hypothetical protein